MIEQAGADALELNIYYIPTDPDMTGAQSRRCTATLVATSSASVQHSGGGQARPLLQLAAHMSPAAGRGGRRRPGALQPLLPAGLRPGDAWRSCPHLTLSNSAELLLRLHWVAILYGHIQADLAVTGGVHTAEDVLKAMMAGARVAMMTSALLRTRHRSHHIGWSQRDLHRVDGGARVRVHPADAGQHELQRCAEPAAFERANYMKVLSSYALTPGPTVQRTDRISFAVPSPPGPQAPAFLLHARGAGALAREIATCHFERGRFLAESRDLALSISEQSEELSSRAQRGNPIVTTDVPAEEN